jgi:hypothetical protein
MADLLESWDALDSPTSRRQREAVPTHDPVPDGSGDLKRRFWRIFRLLAILSVVVAAIAVLFVARGQDEIRVHMLIATALGTGFMVLVGGGLMSLVFLSASSGHDDSIGDNRRWPHDKDSE